MHSVSGLRGILTEETGDPLLQRGEFSKLCIMTAETSQIYFCPSSQDYGDPVLTLQARGCMNLLWEISLVQKEISKDTNIHIWHFLDSCYSVAHSCPILCDPVDRSPPGSSIHGISQARILEWVAIPFSSTAAAKMLQSYLCYPIDGSPPLSLSLVTLKQRTSKKILPNVPSFQSSFKVPLLHEDNKRWPEILGNSQDR